MRIVVLGGGGQLGAAVAHACSSSHEVIAFDHRGLDITDPDRVAAELARLQPAAIVNCAAYNAVDDAEEQQVRALQVNALAVRTVSRSARSLGAALVHYSSDFVFDGTTATPHTEEDRPNPRGVYATSKLLGEWFAADAPRAYVLRVESLFGRPPNGRPEKGSAAVILETLRAGGVARVFEDRTVTPTYLLDAAEATRTILERNLPGGTYHLVNSGWCTWLEFAREAARLMGVEPRLEPIRVMETKLRAPRPQYCALSNEKLAALGIVMPSWRDALARHIAAFDQK